MWVFTRIIPVFIKTDKLFPVCLYHHTNIQQHTARSASWLDDTHWSIVDLLPLIPEAKHVLTTETLQRIQAANLIPRLLGVARCRDLCSGRADPHPQSEGSANRPHPPTTLIIIVIKLLRCSHIGGLMRICDQVI